MDRLIGTWTKPQSLDALLVFVILHENEYFHLAWLEIYLFVSEQPPANSEWDSMDSEEESKLGRFSYIVGEDIKISGSCNKRLYYRSVSWEALPCSLSFQWGHFVHHGNAELSDVTPY